jgi:hypothetical protein
MSRIWNRIGENTPEPDTLIVAYKDGGVSAVFIEDFLNEYTDGNLKNNKQGFKTWLLQQGISHWMHFPRMPKEIVEARYKTPQN